MDTLKTCWESYAEKVVNSCASEGQRDDMRTTFYAGGVAMLRLILNIGADKSLSNSDGSARMRDLVEECQDFANDDDIGRPTNAKRTSVQ